MFLIQKHIKIHAYVGFQLAMTIYIYICIYTNLLYEPTPFAFDVQLTC